MNIYLFGATGMLGNYVHRVLAAKKTYKVIPITREQYNIETDDISSINLIPGSIVINCAGIIPQKISMTDYKMYIKVNAMFPHQLEKLCLSHNCKLIHITTNCVFSGSTGLYLETDKHDADDIYSTTKSLGELTESCVIRSSIIGEELFGNSSLLEWLKTKQNQKINGYNNHLWNGVTCYQLAKIILRIIENGNYWKGVRHIHSPDTLSKYQLCEIINKEYNLNITIEKWNTKISKYLSLSSIYPQFYLPPLATQIKEQREFKLLDTGNYTELNKCRFCGNFVLTDIIHFNDMPLAGGFIQNKTSSLYEKIYPLTFAHCNYCNTGLIKEVISPDKLFTSINGQTYYYYSSTIPSLVTHFTDLSRLIKTKYNPKSIMEIGCNDGVLLNNFDSSVKCIGVDPSNTIKNCSKDIIKYNTYFNDSTANDILEKNGKLDVIVACNCLAHIHDIINIYKNIKNLLAVDGVAIIEVHYLKKIIDNMNFDFIYHEHMSYYSIQTFIEIAKQFGLYIEDIEFIESHGGSLRVFLRHGDGITFYNPKLQKVINDENNTSENISQLFKDIENWKVIIKKEIQKVRDLGYPIIGYGASGRTNTILRYIDEKFDYILDDSEYKIGAKLPYSHTLIKNSNTIYTEKYPVIFILAWPYTNAIIKKHQKYNGTFIQILPEIRHLLNDTLLT